MKRFGLSFSRVSLAALQNGKPFEGMAAGEFIDMYGRKVVIRKEDLPLFVDNSMRNLEATRTSDGELVGFPVDSVGHDHGQAAGWIIGFALNAEKDKILFTPRWTEMGIELLTKGLMRFFSPEYNQMALAIVGGSLTNWPATRTRKEEILLKPIALSVDENGAPSLDERVQKICDEFESQFGEGWSSIWPVEIFEGFLVCRDDDKLYRVGYAEQADGSITFTPQLEWVEVKRSYIDAAMEMFKEFLSRVLPGKAAREKDPAPQAAPVTNEEVELIELSKLTPEQRAELAAQMTSGHAPAELAALIDRMANERVTALLAIEQRKADTIALSARLAGGSPENPRGLPVDKAELADFLMSLSPEQAEKATALLSKVVEKGLIEFGELGHSNQVATKEELPIEYAARLEAGTLTLADLANPVLALGDLSRYDLSKWQEKGK